MKHVIIGTAGHVDHGKSSLIKVLTGLETDRLKEEQKRGITIELGFAYLDLPNGSKAGIIDVPGHERFVHNMLAGAGGIDLALLVIAADEGVMPQTEEHLEILRLLDIKHGLIALTKTDLADPDWIDLVEETVKEEVQGTFFEHSPIHRVSAYTGEGVDELRQAIFKAIEELPEKDPALPFREPIDRVFSVEGFGTVITGTVFEGTVMPGDKLMVYPQEQEVRVRTVQVHDEKQEAAYAGQRTAINLAQVSADEIKSGEILAAPNSLDLSQNLDVRVRISDKSPFTIKNRSRLHFHYGSAEAICQIRLLGKEELLAGEEALARLNFQEDVVLKYGDPFVLRFFSPTVTVGGGHVLDPSPRTMRIKDGPWQERLEQLVYASPQERLLAAIDTGSPYFASLDQALRRSGLASQPKHNQDQAVEELLSKEDIYKLADTVYVSTNFIEDMAKSSDRILSKYHQENPLKSGLRRESMRTSLLPEVRIDYTDKILDLLIKADLIKEQNGLISLTDFSLDLSDDQKALQDKIVADYLAAGFSPPDDDEIIAKYPGKEPVNGLLSNLIDVGRLIRLDDKINIHPEYLEKAKKFAIEKIQAEGSLKLADFRDYIDSSRKYALAILDYFDRIKLTRMQGDVRILL